MRPDDLDEMVDRKREADAELEARHAELEAEYHRGYEAGVLWATAFGGAVPNIYRDVLDFNRAVLPGKVDRTEHGPSEPPKEGLDLGVRLVAEEVCELLEALGYEHGLDPAMMDRPQWAVPVDLEAAADAVADIFYVVLGVAQRLGIDEERFHAVWREVTRANMEKANGPMRADGKRLKPEGWTPPDIARCLWPETEP